MKIDYVRKYPLVDMEISSVVINGNTIDVYLATCKDHCYEGLMAVSKNELGNMGMLFFLDYDVHEFYMRNTIVSLDVAYIDVCGVIKKIYTMPPLVDDTFSSIVPVSYALEVIAGTFDRLGIKEGDIVINKYIFL